MFTLAPNRRKSSQCHTHTHAHTRTTRILNSTEKKLFKIPNDSMLQSEQKFVIFPMARSTWFYVVIRTVAQLQVNWRTSGRIRLQTHSRCVLDRLPSLSASFVDVVVVVVFASNVILDFLFVSFGRNRNNVNSVWNEEIFVVRMRNGVFDYSVCGVFTLVQ